VTRYEVELSEVVLRGLPRGYADELRPLVEARLAALAAGSAQRGAVGSARRDARDDGGPAREADPPRGAPAADPGAVADILAGRIWAAIDGAQREPGR
jgi:hypothetical protein